MYLHSYRYSFIEFLSSILGKKSIDDATPSKISLMLTEVRPELEDYEEEDVDILPSLAGYVFAIYPGPANFQKGFRREEGANPRQLLQVYIQRPNTQQSVIDFQVPSIFDNQGYYNDSVAESLDFMLSYHDIHHPDSTFLIEETNQYVMNLMRENHNIISQHLQVTLAIRDYNLNATARLDVDLIIMDLEVTRQPKRKTIYAPSALRITPM
ncbi:hypothetical protein Bca52824_015149 [Brassica carinata]|uniref:Uncharacterized protein n=1 Tax=Brassica carinata TaxID=52824 RepID=A0A8X7W1L5_BRACI|nr:hypothetical protein Bca52824_015149 [Brassica carinata]